MSAGPGRAGSGEWTFTVAAAIDDEAPEVPVVEAVEYSAYEDEGQARLTLQAAHELVMAFVVPVFVLLRRRRRRDASSKVSGSGGS